MDEKNGLIWRIFFPIVQNYGEKGYFRRFQVGGGDRPIAPMDQPLDIMR